MWQLYSEKLFLFIWIIIISSLLIISISNIISSTINHDVAWYIYAANEFVDGAILYQDVVDVNPPLIIFISIPPVIIADILGLSEITIFKWYIIIIALSISILSYILTIKYNYNNYKWLIRSIFVIIIYLVFVYPLRDFGQREHLMVLFILPYIASIVMSLENIKYNKYVEIIIGLCAGIGFSVKPYFILVWIIIEVYLIIENKNINSIFRYVNGGIVTVFILYAISGIYWFENYINLALLAKESYSAYNSNMTDILQHHIIKYWAVGLILFIVMHIIKSNNKVINIIFIASTCSLFIAIIQQKGWSYHYYPAIFFITIYFLIVMPLTLFKYTNMLLFSINIKRMILILSFLVIAYLLLPNIITSINYRYNNIYINNFTRYVDENASEEYIYIFSSSVYPSFPLINYSNAKWSSRFNCLWLIPGAYNNKNKNSRNYSYKSIFDMDQPERYMFDSIIHDIKDKQPHLLLFDNSKYKQGFGNTSFDYKDYFLSDARFRDIFDDYGFIGEKWGYLIYKIHKQNEIVENNE